MQNSILIDIREKHFIFYHSILFNITGINQIPSNVSNYNAFTMTIATSILKFNYAV